MSDDAEERRRAAWRVAYRVATRALEARLTANFVTLLAALERPPDELARRPAPGAWSALEVLEHVALTSQYLLLLARKLAERSRRRVERGLPWPAAGPGDAVPGSPAAETLAAVARDRRHWPHPAHMTPTDERTPAEVARMLRGQRDEARALLLALPAGEGTLHRIRVSVLPPGADRLDLYGMLEFLGRHAERHARQVAEALGEAPDQE